MVKDELIPVYIRLEKEKYEQLRLLSFQTGKSQAEIVRVALADYFNKLEKEGE